MRTGMDILFHVSLFPKYLVTNGTIIYPRKENVEKGNATIHLNLHPELDGVRLRSKVVKKQVEFLLTMRPNDTCIINKPLSFFRVKLSSGLGLKIFHKQVSNDRGKMGAHRNTANFLIQLTLETKESRGEAEAN